MPKNIARRLAFGLVFLALPGAARASAPTAQTLQVDVLAVDSRGHSVEGLGAADFDVRSRGRARSAVEVRYVAPADAPRTIVFVVDDLALSVESVYRVRQSIASFLEHDMRPDDRVAILATFGESSHPLTGDKKVLKESLTHLHYNTLERTRVVNSEAVAHRFSLFGTLGSLESMVTSMKAVPGRKMMVVFSEGIEAGPYVVDPTVRDGLQRVVDAANQASVVIHTIDARGVPGAFSSAWITPLRQAQQAGLEWLADATGGVFLRNTELASGLTRLLDSEGGYYVVRWTEPAARPGGQSVDVRVNRTGIKTRVRTEVFAAKADGI
jgi:VWFA-related protein